MGFRRDVELHFLLVLRRWSPIRTFDIPLQAICNAYPHRPTAPQPSYQNIPHADSADQNAIAAFPTPMVFVRVGISSALMMFRSHRSTRRRAHGHVGSRSVAARLVITPPPVPSMVRNGKAEWHWLLATGHSRCAADYRPRRWLAGIQLVFAPHLLATTSHFLVRLPFALVTDEDRV
jgi:hypothetical protein